MRRTVYGLGFQCQPYCIFPIFIWSVFSYVFMDLSWKLFNISSQVLLMYQFLCSFWISQLRPQEEVAYKFFGPFPKYSVKLSFTYQCYPQKCIHDKKCVFSKSKQTLAKYCKTPLTRGKLKNLILSQE